MWLKLDENACGGSNRSLAEKGLVEQEKYGHIELTETGIKVGKMYMKGISCLRFFQLLGLIRKWRRRCV